ncbi:NUDIX domain-containing protein [Polaromonas sp. SM01]|uniref:NUDIX hydrolase n=1 Tax=Polaromonas sp. SM01 TaxID=3085630 RepID=UPI002981D676|nr:NUDIX domain-containing protein [Polaromonas sp. SM01]MDW5441607.1 NUDIX domain-containing protein [Polaromonas sp. SM01]
MNPLPTSQTHTIRIAAALLSRDDGRTLLVRKRGTQAFMQPGGKIEPGEEPVAALVRELYEELGLVIAPSRPAYLGCFVAPAANEPGWMVEAEIFHLHIAEAVMPAAEIEEIVWVDPLSKIELPLAPLTQAHVLPLYAGLASISENF